MSLTRAFTTRRVKMSIDLAEAAKERNSNVQRSQSTKERSINVVRHKISAPLELTHTTNMLSYNAPDIPRASRSNSSLNSSLNSDLMSETQSTAESTPPTSPDVCEVPGPALNHLSTYFMAPGKAWTPSNAEPAPAPAPAIPQRSPSHTKKNSYENIARQRSAARLSRESEHSVSTKSSASFSRSSSTSTRASSVSSNFNMQVQKPIAPPQVPAPAPSVAYQQRTTQPFRRELAKVTELTEEFSSRTLSKIDEEDFEYIQSHGLRRFAAQDYLNDIHGLASGFFNDAIHARPAQPLWI